MRIPRRPESHTLAGAYALDAIDGPDRARFERHLARCPACAAELRELREATARLAGAAAGLTAVTAEHHLSTARQSDHAIAEVLNAPDAVLLTARVTAGGTATVVMSRQDRALVFTTDGLPPLGAGHCYQLWLMGQAGDRPAGVLPAPDHRMTSPVIATGLAAGDWVALTVEPVGRSPGSATAPILMLNLTA